MPKLEIQIGDELHRVVYIDYSDGIPHEVMTMHFISYADKPYWRLCWWIFFANNGDKNDIRAYKAGSGGNPKEIHAPQWADGYIGRYWISDDAKFRGEPRNAKRLKNPKIISEKSRNPFKVAEITYSREYCEMCGHESTEFCDEHKYEDDEGNERYIHNDEICDD